MNFRSFVVFSISALFIGTALSACQDHKPAIDTFGQLDSAAIAADTTMQVNMDRSYEYLRTFAEGDTVAYDLLAYDKPKNSSGLEWESKFLVIRRAKGVQDTIAKESRQGKVRSAWLSDMDHNGRSEIFFYTRADQETKGAQDYTLYVLEAECRGKAHDLFINIPQEHRQEGQADSFFTQDDLLIRSVTLPQTGDGGSAKGFQQTYKLVSGKLIIEKQTPVIH